MNITYTFESLALTAPGEESLLNVHTVKIFKDGVEQTEYTYSGGSIDQARQVELQFISWGAKRQLTVEQRNELIGEWFNAQQQMAFWKAKEWDLRSSVVSEYFTIGKGTQRVDLDGGWQLVIERGEDYKLNNKEGQVDKALENFDDTMGALLVTWKPDISKKTYDALPDEQKAHFNDCLEIKPSSPQVKLAPPKASKG